MSLIRKSLILLMHPHYWSFLYRLEKIVRLCISCYIFFIFKIICKKIDLRLVLASFIIILCVNYWRFPTFLTLIVPPCFCLFTLSSPKHDWRLMIVLWDSHQINILCSTLDHESLCIFNVDFLEIWTALLVTHWYHTSSLQL